MDMKKILVATDFSHPAAQLMDCIAAFKSFGLDEVVLVHVIDVRPQGDGAPYQRLEQEQLDIERVRLEAMGLKVTAKLPIGVPHLEIVKIAAQEQVSVIMISSRGKSIVNNILLGSTTNDVIRTSSVPVLIEKYRDMDQETYRVLCTNQFKKILLPLDFSVHSRKLLEVIRDLAPLIEEVILLTVVEPAHDEGFLLKTVEIQDAQLNRAKQDLELLGLKVKTILRQGSAPTAIIEAAEREDVSLIVIATHGEGLFKQLLLGSTAQGVVRHSQRSVLLIPSKS